jgi:LacI family transcriptional regulator
MATRHQRRPTIKEVAKRARVSVGTVSHVLSGTVSVSDELRNRVQQAVEELDYHPDHVARSLKVRHTKMLGMVISDISNPFFPQMVRGAEDAAWRQHNLLITFNTDDQISREKEIFKTLRSRRVDGVLLVAAVTEGPQEHIQALVDSGIPVVLVDRKVLDFEADMVIVDNRAGARDAVRELVRQGYRRIGLLGGLKKLLISKERRAGYLDALKEGGLAHDRSLEAYGIFRIESGYEQAASLLDRPDRPDAIFAANGQMGEGLVRAMRERGLRCAEDIGVACFDELPYPESERAACVVQPAYQIGCRGVDVLLQRIADRDAPYHTVVLPTVLRTAV